MQFTDLSAELLSLIVSCLKQTPDRGRLASYTTICAGFRDAIEAETFSDLSITSDELQMLYEFMERRQQRRAILGFLRLSVVLPTYSDQACGWYERKPDQDRNDESFTESMRKLFRVLSKCDRMTKASPIDVSLERIYSPMDPPHRSREKRKADQFAYELGQRRDLFEHRYEHSYIHLLAAQDLPEIRRVRSLAILKSGGSRNLDSAIGLMLGRLLPNLESINLYFNDEERKYARRRHLLRKGLCEAIPHWRPSRVTKLHLALRHSPPSNEDFRNSDMRDDAGSDQLSRCLGQFIQASNLVDVKLHGPICIGLDLFCASEGAGKRWLNLQTFHVDVSSVRPDGGWYLVRDPEPPTNQDESSDDGEDEDEHVPDHWRSPTPSSLSSSDFDSDDSFFEEVESQRPPDTFRPKRHARQIGEEPCKTFRTYPTPEAEALLEAATRMIANSKTLKIFQIDIWAESCRRTEYEKRSFGFTFARKGTSHFLDEREKDAERNRVWWEAPRNWIMNEKWKELWSEIFGEGETIRWTEW